MDNLDKIYLSVVVPFYNEEGNVVELHRQILAVCQQLGKPFEIIFVNDGSSDKSLDEMKKLSPVKIINFRKNFGQTAALDAGIKMAQGEIVVTLDGDLQNDPADIPLLLQKVNEGYDVVSGWRWQRKDSLMKRFCSRGANGLRKVLINDHIHDSGCTLKAYRRECFEKVDLYGEMHRFIPAILQWQGYRVAEIKVNHRPRIHGVTKYKLGRVVKGFLDMLSVWFWRKYSNRPLHLFGGLGLTMSFVGVVILLVLFILRILGIISLAGRIWPLVGVFMILLGIQLFVSGILADISVKIYHRNNNRTYSIKEIIER
ncbi:MAG: glycosyltransferase family 2 protein [Patescibacteria group bacterium]